MVLGAYYTIHSMDIPDAQTNGTLNKCFRSVESHIALKAACHRFKIVRGFRKSTLGKFTVAFESACSPGYYLAQKNYKLVLAPNDGTTLFGN